MNPYVLFVYKEIFFYIMSEESASMFVAACVGAVVIVVVAIILLWKVKISKSIIFPSFKIVSIDNS